MENNDPIDANQIQNVRHNEDAQTEIDKLNRHIKGVARSFYWIAGFALVSSIIKIMHLPSLDAFNLGLPRVMAPFFMLFAQNYFAWLGISLLLLVLSFFIIGALIARKRMWALWLGVCLYALDAIPLLLDKEWFPVMVHVVSLYWISRGFSLLWRMERVTML